MKVSNCLLPKKFHASHSLCSALVDELEAFITEKDFLGLREQTINIDSEQKPLENESVLDYLIGIDERTLHDKCIENSIIHAILIDMIYFLKEALSASTKQRLTVTFALLRKPLVYDLVVLLRLFFTSDFLSRFNSEAGFDTTKLPKADLLELLDLSINTLI
jgi:hypothetical protein